MYLAGRYLNLDFFENRQESNNNTSSNQSQLSLGLRNKLRCHLVDIDIGPQDFAPLESIAHTKATSGLNVIKFYAY